MAIFDQDAEQMDREELAQMQLERLQATLTRVYKNVKFYKKKFDELGFLPEDCQSLEDLARLPFTTRHDLARAYPYEMFAVPLREVVRIHSSTGSPGNPIVMGYTSRDLRHWAKLAARILTAAGVDRDDVVQVTLSYSLLDQRLRHPLRRGAPGGLGDPQRPRFHRPPGPGDAGLPHHRPGLHPVLRPGAGRRDGGPWGWTPRTSTSSWRCWPGSPGPRPCGPKSKPACTSPPWTTTPCPRPWVPGWPGSAPRTPLAGMHLSEDHFLPEVIDPVTGELLPPGELGELVITTLTREATPLVRFRTGDLVRLFYEPCPCGRTLARMSRIEGRCDEVVIVKGINIFPTRVGQILAAIQGEEPAYQLVVGREGHLDYLEVRIEVREDLFFDKMTKQREILAADRPQAGPGHRRPAAGETGGAGVAQPGGRRPRPW